MNNILKSIILSSCIVALIQASEKPLVPVTKAAITNAIPKPPSKPVIKKPAPVINNDNDSDDDNNDWVAKIREADPNVLDDHRSHKNQESVKACTFKKEQKKQKTFAEEGN